MSAISDLAQLADRPDSEIEEKFLAIVEARDFPPGCGAETVELVTNLASDGRRALAIAILEAAHPEFPAEEAIPVLQRLARHVPDTPGLATDLVERIMEVQGTDPTVRAALKASGLGRGGNLLADLDRYESFLAVRKGLYVRHRGDWGTGRIGEVDALTGQVTVDFENKPGHTMTMEGVVDLLDYLDEDAWPARKFDRLDELKEKADSDPIVVLRLVLDHLGGRAELPGLRAELKGSVIPDGRWSRWWSSAKKAAQRDPYLEVVTKGGSTRIEKREEALSPADEIRSAIDSERSFAAKWRVARTAHRSFAEQEESKSLVEPLVTAVTRRWEKIIDKSRVALVECLIFLETHEWPEASERIDQVAALGDATILPQLGSKDDQRRYAEALKKMAPEGWLEQMEEVLLDTGTKVRGLIRKWFKAERADLLTSASERVVADPHHYPEAFVEVLTNKWKVDVDEMRLTRIAARFGHDITRDERLGRIRSVDKFLRKASDFLSKQNFARCRQYIGEQTVDEVRRLASYLRRTPALEDIYTTLLNDFTQVVPDLVKGKERKFWEEADAIFTTEAGQDRRQEELRHLMDVEIPENSRAIGEAASLGDLSENAEWSAAIEKQKELTEKAKAMREELERARVLDDETLPAEMVCPGTVVRLTDPENEEEVTYTVLGPWDIDIDSGVLSYLSPIAGGLLGKRVGEEAEIELPDKTQRLRVEEIHNYFEMLAEEEDGGASDDDDDDDDDDEESEEAVASSAGESSS